jgi:sulfite reductase subunit B
MENIFMPWKAQILQIDEQPCSVKIFKLKVRKDFTYETGQFVEVSLPGIGEMPICLSSSPCDKGFIEICVRAVGSVTNAVHGKKVGDALWIRGPYGVGFPYDSIKGRDIVFVAGGIGMFPVRSSINMILANKKEFGKVTILYGAKTPTELFFKNEFDKWTREANFLTSVDSPNLPDGTGCGWTGNIGVVTTLFDKIPYPVKDAVGIVCGPPVMYKFVIKKFKEAGMDDRSIFLSLERMMKCGVGKCQHCQVNNRYVCMDGPVFNYAEAKDLPEAL